MSSDIVATLGKGAQMSVALEFEGFKDSSGWRYSLFSSSTPRLGVACESL
jgi:hypothetical protein